MFGNYYFQFINNIPQNSLFHQGEYHPGLVILSIAIAIFTSYTAFLMGQFSEPVTSKQIRFALLSLSGLAMGVGIWAMHFIGMLGFHLPCGISYNPWLTAFLNRPRGCCQHLCHAFCFPSSTEFQSITDRRNGLWAWHRHNALFRHGCYGSGWIGSI